MTLRSASFPAALAMLTACGSGSPAGPALPAVPVEGGAHDLQMLIGDWEGQFTSVRGSRRQGTIAFSLHGGGDTAYGRVVLRGPPPPPGCTDPVSRATESRVVGDILLTLGGVNIGGRSISGWLRPYRDPELGCWKDTWFEGTIRGDTLDGMYFSHPADSAQAVRLGSWWVARRK
jgi:hypothetical protein